MPVAATGCEEFFTGVDIGDGQGAGRDLQRTTVFGYTTGIHTGDHGSIIGTGDGDDDVMGGAVNGGDLNSIVHGGIERQGLYGCIGIVERVGPRTGSVDGQRAIGAGSSDRL